VKQLPCHQLQVTARKQLHEQTNLKHTDDLYSSYLSLRSRPFKDFVGGAEPKWVLPMSSVNEDCLLQHLGLSRDERMQMEGLQVGRQSAAVDGSGMLEEEKRVTRAVVRLAAAPPPQTGALQRLSSNWLLRPLYLSLGFEPRSLACLQPIDRCSNPCACETVRLG
jgi:hypothetical protein